MFGNRATVVGKLILVVGWLLYCDLRCPAQTGTNSIEVSASFFNQVWQTEDGLPHNDVHGVALGADGFLWVGTRRGLVRFDGNHFVPGRSRDGVDLAQISVWRMRTDAEGVVLAAFENGGVAARNGDSFQPYKIGSESSSQRVFSMCTDQTGALWTVSLEGRVERLFDSAVKSLGSPGTGPAGPSTLVTDSQGLVWLASKGALGYFQGDEFVPVASDLPPPLFISPMRAGGVWLATSERLSRVEKGPRVTEIARLPWGAGESNVRDMLEDRSGALWLGTSRKGLIRFDDGRFQSVATSHNNILCLAEDGTGNLWVGTQGGGLNRVRQRQFQVLDTRRGLPNDSVFSFAEDTAGRVWMATQDGGLCYWSNSVVTVLGEAEGWQRLPPLCLAADAQGGVWIGMQKYGLLHWVGGKFQHVTEELGLKIDILNCLLVDRAGRVWAGSMLEGLYCVEGGNAKHYTTKDGLPADGVRSVIEDKLGALWVGTDDGGLARFTNGTFQKFTHPHWSGDAVRALLSTEDGSIWLGTVGRGLLRFKNGLFTQVNLSQGLPDDSIQQLMLDDTGWLWCGTSRGLFRAGLRELSAAADGSLALVPTFSYGRSDGLAEFQFNGEFQPAVIQTRAGRFWFASVKGAVVFQPGTLPQNRELPNLIIETITRNGEELKASNVALLRPGVRHLEFRFVTPDFSAPERVRYRHKLDGTGRDWSAASPARMALYTNLQPGSYRFQVVACNADGVWNEQGESFAFTVAPFFWQTRWFPAVAVALLVGLLALLGRWLALRRLQRRVAVLEQESALEKERARIAQDIHDELGANLTTIGWLADRGKKHQAEPATLSGELDKIAMTARESLTAMDAIVWALNSRNDSLENFADYISHFANEFFRPTAIRCRLDIPTELPPHPMSTEARHHLFLAVKEALNNVARHSRATEVWIRLNCVNDRLLISVEDNGRGIEATSPEPGQDGLANIRRRLEKLSGTLSVKSDPASAESTSSPPESKVASNEKGGSNVRPAPGGGTCLRFTVPLVRLNL